MRIRGSEKICVALLYESSWKAVHVHSTWFNGCSEKKKKKKTQTNKQKKKKKKKLRESQRFLCPSRFVVSQYFQSYILVRFCKPGVATVKFVPKLWSWIIWSRTMMVHRSWPAEMCTKTCCLGEVRGHDLQGCTPWCAS